MATPDDLRAMDLQLKAINDEYLVYGQWTRLAAVHELAKESYQSDVPKDDGDCWRYGPPTSNATSAYGIPRCNLPAAIARLRANVPGGGLNDTDKDIPEEGFVVKKKLAEWAKKQMLFSKASEKNFVHLDVAAPMSAYRVGNYVNYIPIRILDTEQFKAEFITKHGTDVPKLKKEHISVAFSIFQCGLQLVEEQQVDEHCRQTHGLVEGINSLSPLQVITVDRDQVFKCPDLQRMEDVGPEEREMLSNSVSNMSVAKGVFQVINNNKSQADLKRNRAQEFLEEVRKACSKNYYGRFNMLLGNELVTQGLKIAGDFTVKWQTVQDCLFKAIVDEQGVTRMANFLALNYTKFSDQPLELLFNRVDREVDAFLGKTNEVFEDSKKRKHCLLTHILMTKYEIIFNIVRNLDSKFTLLKECVQKEVSKFYFNPTTILDIPDLQKHLYDKLDPKSLSTQYRTEPVIVGRKIPVHAAGLKETANQAEWTPE